MANPFDFMPDLYDAIYAVSQKKDYATEAAELVEIIEERSSGARSLLDVACGTGRHIQFLRERFSCTGLDSSDGLLDVARNRQPDIEFVQGDMMDFDLGRRFDVVTCLFSAIGYTKTLDRLDDSIAAMAKHVAPGGLLIVEPWLQPDDFEEGALWANYVDDEGLKIAEMSVNQRQGNLSIMEMHYLVGLPEGIEHRVARHEIGLFTWERQREAFEKAGLDSVVDPHGLIGRGLIVGQRA